jgi:hypothetical protein
MTVQLIRHTAKEFAGIFYDGNRSLRFRGQKISQKQFVAHAWIHFVDAARSVLTDMLTQPGVPDRQKHKIYEALIEDRKREQAQMSRAIRVPQQTPGYSDSNKEMDWSQ